MSSPIWIDHDTSEGDLGEGQHSAIVLEYKYVKGAWWKKDQVDWESGANRKVVLQCNLRHGQIWSICDAEFGFTNTLPRLLTDTLAGVIERRLQVDPAWATQGKLAHEAQTVPLLAPGPPARPVKRVQEIKQIKEIEEDSCYQRRMATIPTPSRRQAAAPDVDEVQKLRRESEDLKAVLRLIASEQEPAVRRRKSTGTAVAGPPQDEVRRQPVDPRRLNRRSFVPPSCVQVSQALTTGALAGPPATSWDWPLSRSEKKVRLLVADVNVMALDQERHLALQQDETERTSAENKALQTELERLRVARTVLASS